jgi:L-Ala-D/L-Glu epimerase
MQVSFRRVDWELASIFRIAYMTRTHAQTVVAELRDGEVVGRGEALGVHYHGETAASLIDELEDVAASLADGLSRGELQELLPPGGARNALDCALWDLEAKRLRRRVWELVGMRSVRPLTTAYTLGADTPEAMARAAAATVKYSVLKIKLTGDDDLERVRLVRQARADATLIVDANQSWDERQLQLLAPQLAALDVKLIEQPLAAGQDDALTHFRSPVPLCADESCQTSASLPALVGKYQYVNIKLDKTGGLTEALRLAHRARESGLKLMVGCMSGSSLSMAPGFVVGQLCDVVDLDGPLLAKADVPGAIRYEGSCMFAPDAGLWG